MSDDLAADLRALTGVHDMTSRGRESGHFPADCRACAIERLAIRAERLQQERDRLGAMESLESELRTELETSQRSVTYWTEQAALYAQNVDFHRGKREEAEAERDAWTVPPEFRPKCPVDGHACTSWTCLVDVCVDATKESGDG